MNSVIDAKTQISDYLQSQHVLTLCTNSAKDLWCASCFYLFDRQSMIFLLLSDRQTQHAVLMAANPVVCGTITAQIAEVSQLQGVQFKGRIMLLDGEGATSAIQAYCRRFPIAKTHSAPIWRLEIDLLKMVNNKLGFGHKLVWQRGH